MDAIGGIAVGIFIITVSYVVLKQASLALLDAYHNPKLAEDIQKIVEANGVTVNHILLRAAGPYIHAEIHLWVDSSTTIAQLDQIKDRINSSLRKKSQVYKELLSQQDPDRHLSYYFFYLTTCFLRLTGTCVNHQW